MAEESFLSDDLLRQLVSVGEVDLLVGIPSHNNADTIALAVEAIEESFQRHFPRARVVIVNVDTGSTDGTSDLFLNNALPNNGNSRGLTSLRTERRVAARYDDPSQVTIFRTIVTTADLLRAKACAVVSPATPNLLTERVQNLLQPLVQRGFDFVAPLYSRQRFDGLLTRMLLYPMSRAMFGRRIREISPAEFGFSGRMAAYWLSREIWQDATLRDLPQEWMVLSAICADFRSCQSFLGPKVPFPARTVPDIVTAVCQAVGTLFWFIESNQAAWMSRTESEPVTTFGPDHEFTSEPMAVNLERISELFRSGVAELFPILSAILSPTTNAEIQRLVALGEKHLCFPNALWARILYDFAASYHHTLLNRDHLLQALVPLYRGKIYSFFLEHAESSADQIEADLENLCLELERQKPYLIERWNMRNEVTA